MAVLRVYQEGWAGADSSIGLECDSDDATLCSDDTESSHGDYEVEIGEEDSIVLSSISSRNMHQR